MEVVESNDDVVYRRKRRSLTVADEFTRQGCSPIGSVMRHYICAKRDECATAENRSPEWRARATVRLLSYILYRLYPFMTRRCARTMILRIVRKLEGGEMVSRTLRRIYLDYHDIRIGMYSYGGCFDLERIGPHTKIGRYCSFAPGVCILNANHPMELKSTHASFFYPPPVGYGRKKEGSRCGIEIGSDVWVGQNAIILPGTRKIGDGAVIGAGSIVTKDVPDFAIVAGNPAKIIRYRFGEATIRRLKEERWWEKDMGELREHLDEFLRPLEQQGCEMLQSRL